MTDLFTDAFGVLAVLGLILWLRRLHRLVPPELARARDLQKTDPASGQLLVDSYWAEQAAHEKERRAALWQRAPTDVRAAKELRKHILEDLKLNKAAMTDFGAQGESLDLIHKVERDLREQLEKVDAIIRSLPPAP